MQGEQAAMVITAPPYNVSIEGNVSGLGAIRGGNRGKGTGSALDRRIARQFTPPLTSESVLPGRLRVAPAGATIGAIGGGFLIHSFGCEIPV
jgi:hypothetical protein